MVPKLVLKILVHILTCQNRTHALCISQWLKYLITVHKFSESISNKIVIYTINVEEHILQSLEKPGVILLLR